jgi:hypothetical protein
MVMLSCLCYAFGLLTTRALLVFSTLIIKIEHQYDVWVSTSFLGKFVWIYVRLIFWRYQPQGWWLFNYIQVRGDIAFIENHVDFGHGG